jgi:Flp pilus assembly pilin Flp
VAVLSLVIAAGVGRAGNALEDMFSDQERALQRTLAP